MYLTVQLHCVIVIIKLLYDYYYYNYDYSSVKMLLVNMLT